MYRCKTCKNNHVQEQAWVDINTGKFEGLVDNEEEYWCEDCEEFCEIYYDEEKQKKDV